MDQDYVLCECNLERLEAFVEQLEKTLTITLVQPPQLCLTMLEAEDSVEAQAFYLGEALTTYCEVAIAENLGYGIVLEDQPQRAYCMAVIDALLNWEAYDKAPIEEFLQKEWAHIQAREREENYKIMQSRVDFKLMEEA